MIKKHIKLYFLAVLVAVIVGSAVALFLWLLDQVVKINFKFTWLLFLLPIAGIVIHLIYRLAGESSEKGNTLIIEEIHEPGGGVPGRMAPVVLLTTLITQLFGGSVGREGTAVQMGGSIAAMIGNLFKLNGPETSTLLIMGIAAGFGAVFGTPVTGAIFALEVLIIRRPHFSAFFPALLVAFIADLTVAAWHIHHVAYTIDPVGQPDHSAWLTAGSILIAKVIVAAAAFGLVSYLFVTTAHFIKTTFLKFIKMQWLIPVAGGCIVIGLTLLLNRSDYLGLGVTAPYPGAVTVPSAFHPGGAGTWSWFWKTIYTTVTLGSGFKGGEVTPLFYIGATLGNTLSRLLDAPCSLFAALGFIAVFAGATKTPMASTVMGAELFGTQHLVLFALACFGAYLFRTQADRWCRFLSALPLLLPGRR